MTAEPPRPDRPGTDRRACRARICCRSLPLRANTASDVGGRDVLWLGPDEWLVVADPDAAHTIVRELEDALSGHHHSILDVSANRIVFELIDGLEALSSGCGLDLHPSSLDDRGCAPRPCSAERR